MKRSKVVLYFTSICLLLLFIPTIASANQLGDSIINNKLVIINIAGFSRDEIAKIIQEVEKKNPKVIGIDAWFTLVRSDTLLLPTLNAYNNIVIAVKLTNCKNHNCDSLTGQYFSYEKEGHVMVNYQKLKYVPSLKHKDKEYPFFCLALLNEYDNSIVKKFYKKRLHKKKLQFYGNYNSFATIEGKDILTQNYSWNTKLEDKVIILGYLGSKIGIVNDPTKETDFKLASLSNGRLPDMYGVIMLANILTDIMKRTKRIK